MNVPIVAGAVSPALLSLIAQAAARYERANRLYPAVKNVNFERYRPTHQPLCAKGEIRPMSVSQPLAEIDESDVDTCDAGLYRIRGKAKRGEYYRVDKDEFVQDVPLVMLARVDDGQKELPVGVEVARIRPDGKRLIMAWVEDQTLDATAEKGVS